MTKIHRLGVVLSLPQVAYRARAVGSVGAGRVFYSESIAVSWCSEQKMLTGNCYEIYEIQPGF